ncbi:retrovirus-related pol polyprotein from transposon TNT 1-94 [Tanacetum coccineum]
MVRRLGLFQAYDQESEATHNFFWKFIGTVRFRNDHIATFLGYGDLQWGNILIARVYFVEGLGHNLFLVGQFCDSYLEVAFKRNTCFVRNLEGVDLLKENRTANLYTINPYEMASASPICLMARATSTKSWLWHQHLSHLNFDTINDLAKNDLVAGLPKFKYSKEHLCLSYEQGKRKKAPHPPKLVPNSKQRLHLLHMDLCRPMRVDSINRKRWTTTLVTLGTDNGTEFKNQVLKEYFDDVGISHQTYSVKTPQQNGVVERRNRMLVENDREDIGKLGTKGDIGFFIGYSANSRAYRIYNRRTSKIMETMDVKFDELLSMDFEQRSSKPGLQGVTFGQISSGLDLTYAPSTISSQKPTERKLDLLFEAMYDDYIGGQPSASPRPAPVTPAPQVLQTPTASKTMAVTAPTPTDSSSQDADIPNTSQDVDELQQQQHDQQQDDHVQLQPEAFSKNVPNAMFDGNTFVNLFASPSTSSAESSS